MPDEVRTSPNAYVSQNPADHDGVVPKCSFCSSANATRMCAAIGNALACEECFQDWLNGGFDEE
jgi:hypothetical protein